MKDILQSEQATTTQKIDAVVRETFYAVGVPANFEAVVAAQKIREQTEDIRHAKGIRVYKEM